MVAKTVARSVVTGGLVLLLTGLCLLGELLGGQRPATSPLAGSAPQAPSSQGRDACTTSPSSPTKPAEARVAAWTCLREALNNRDADHRIQAVYALGTLGVQSDTVSLIEARLEDKDSLVRQAAAKTLGDMQAYQSIPKLHTALDDKSAAVSFATAQALWRMGDQSGTSILAQVLAGERGVSPGLIHSECLTCTSSCTIRLPSRSLARCKRRVLSLVPRDSV